MPTSSGKSIMCAYKLCKVEFRYWGMQTKIEKFIHEVGEFIISIYTFIFTDCNYEVICNIITKIYC